MRPAHAVAALILALCALVVVMLLFEESTVDNTAVVLVEAGAAGMDLEDMMDESFALQGQEEKRRAQAKRLAQKKNKVQKEKVPADPERRAKVGAKALFRTQFVDPNISAVKIAAQRKERNSKRVKKIKRRDVIGAELQSFGTRLAAWRHVHSQLLKRMPATRKKHHLHKHKMVLGGSSAQAMANRMAMIGNAHDRVRAAERARKKMRKELRKPLKVDLQQDNVAAQNKVHTKATKSAAGMQVNLSKAPKQRRPFQHRGHKVKPASKIHAAKANHWKKRLSISLTALTHNLVAKQVPIDETPPEVVQPRKHEHENDHMAIHVVPVPTAASMQKKQRMTSALRLASLSQHFLNDDTSQTAKSRGNSAHAGHAIHKHAFRTKLHTSLDPFKTESKGLPLPKPVSHSLISREAAKIVPKKRLPKIAVTRKKKTKPNLLAQAMEKAHKKAATMAVPDDDDDNDSTKSNGEDEDGRALTAMSAFQSEVQSVTRHSILKKKASQDYKKDLAMMLSDGESKPTKKMQDRPPSKDYRHDTYSRTLRNMQEQLSFSSPESKAKRSYKRRSERKFKIQKMRRRDNEVDKDAEDSVSTMIRHMQKSGKEKAKVMNKKEDRNQAREHIQKVMEKSDKVNKKQASLIRERQRKEEIRRIHARNKAKKRYAQSLESAKHADPKKKVVLSGAAAALVSNLIRPKHPGEMRDKVDAKRAAEEKIKENNEKAKAKVKAKLKAFLHAHDAKKKAAERKKKKIPVADLLFKKAREKGAKLRAKQKPSKADAMADMMEEASLLRNTVKQSVKGETPAEKKERLRAEKREVHAKNVVEKRIAARKKAKKLAAAKKLMAAKRLADAKARALAQKEAASKEVSKKRQVKMDAMKEKVSKSLAQVDQDDSSEQTASRDDETVHEELGHDSMTSELASSKHSREESDKMHRRIQGETVKEFFTPSTTKTTKQIAHKRHKPLSKRTTQQVTRDRVRKKRVKLFKERISKSLTAALHSPSKTVPSSKYNANTQSQHALRTHETDQLPAQNTRMQKDFVVSRLAHKQQHAQLPGDNRKEKKRRNARKEKVDTHSKELTKVRRKQAKVMAAQVATTKAKRARKEKADTRSKELRKVRRKQAKVMAARVATTKAKHEEQTAQKSKETTKTEDKLKATVQMLLKLGRADLAKSLAGSDREFDILREKTRQKGKANNATMSLQQGKSAKMNVQQVKTKAAQIVSHQNKLHPTTKSSEHGKALGSFNTVKNKVKSEVRQAHKLVKTSHRSETKVPSANDNVEHDAERVLAKDRARKSAHQLETKGQRLKEEEAKVVVQHQKIVSRGDKVIRNFKSASHHYANAIHNVQNVTEKLSPKKKRDDKEKARAMLKNALTNAKHTVMWSGGPVTHPSVQTENTQYHLAVHPGQNSNEFVALHTASLTPVPSGPTVTKHIKEESPADTYAALEHKLQAVQSKLALAKLQATSEHTSFHLAKPALEIMLEEHASDREAKADLHSSANMNTQMAAIIKGSVAQALATVVPEVKFDEHVAEDAVHAKLRA
jgi:hypothetical protein